MTDTENGTQQVLDRIRNEYDHFTPAQKAIAEYVLHNPESLMFMPINELAGASGVSTASIVRFCNALGFDGYTQLTKEMQQTLQGQLSTAGRFRIAQSARANQSKIELEKWGDSAFSRILTHEIENLNRLPDVIKAEEFYQAAELIHLADRILILGTMASASLAGHMGRMLSKVYPEVDVVDSEGVLNAAKLLRLTSRSAAFVIAFPRYPSATVRLGRMLADADCQVVSITDTHLSPISGLGHITFHIPVGIPSYVDAYAAPITFINALCTHVAEIDPSQAAASLADFDEFALKGSLFDKQIWRGRPRKNGKG